VALLALVAVVIHGGALRGAQDRRSGERKVAQACPPIGAVADRTVAFGVPVTAAVRPRAMHNFSEYPLAYVIPLAVAVSLAAMWVFERRAKQKAAFLSSCAYIVAMLAGVAAARCIPACCRPAAIPHATSPSTMQ